MVIGCPVSLGVKSQYYTVRSLVGRKQTFAFEIVYVLVVVLIS